MTAHIIIGCGLLFYAALVGFALVLAKSAGERDVVYQTRPQESSRNVVLKRRHFDWAKDEVAT